MGHQVQAQEVKVTDVIKQEDAASYEKTAPEVLKLDWIISYGITHNPEIIALEHEARASQELIKPAGALDDPIVSVGIMNFPLIDMSFRSSAMTQKKIELSQKFPFPGKRTLREKIAAYEAESIENKYYEKQRDIIYQIKKVYYELSYVNESIKTVNKNIELLYQFIKITQIKYEVGKGSQQDILRAQIELSRLKEELITLEEKKETLKARLQSIAYMPETNIISDPDPMLAPDYLFSSEELMETALINRPLINQYQSLIDKYETKYNLARKNVLPDFKISGAYGQRDNGFADIFSLNVSFNLPIYKRRKQDKLIQSADYKLMAISAELESVINDISFNIQDAMIELRKEKRLIDLFKNSILPQTNHVLDATLVNYETGKTDFLSVIDSQMLFYKNELDYLISIRNYYQQLARIEKQVGTSLF
jgi:outer membrane protein TolC